MGVGLEMVSVSYFNKEHFHHSVYSIMTLNNSFFKNTMIITPLKVAWEVNFSLFFETYILPFNVKSD